MLLQQVKEFKEYLVMNGLAPKTIESYITDVKQFHDYLQQMGGADNTELRRFYVTSLKDYLVDNNYSVASINKKVNSLHSCNRFLMERGVMDRFVVHVKQDRIKVAMGSERERWTFLRIGR